MYKYSIYNIDTTISENQIAVWNSKTGAIVIFSKEEYNNILNSNFDDNSTSELRDLISQGILVHENIDEFNSVYFKSKQKQLQFTDRFSFVIAPTLNCNYNCFYCFENCVSSSNVTMPPVEVDNVLLFIKNIIENNKNIKYLEVHWFGGEPLLEYDTIIVPILKNLSDYCNENNIVLDSHIVTNGSLLTKEKFEDFIIKYRNSHFQITFDGTKKEYAKRKGVAENYYELAKNNLIELSKFLSDRNLDYKIDVRLNADNNNLESLKCFVLEIKQSIDLKNIKFHLGRLRGYTSCSNDYFSLEEFWNATNEFDKFLNRRPKIEEPKPVWCGQYCVNCICIGPNGELYKCEHDFGKKEKIVGDIINGLYYNDFYCKYMNNPIPNKCKSCQLFPICLGGCPSIRYNDNKEDCEYILEYFKQKIKKIIKEGGYANDHS